jgi:hypothetical protein
MRSAHERCGISGSGLSLSANRPNSGKRIGHLLHRPHAMHLHRGFGDADIVSNLFPQAAASHLNHGPAFART